MSRALNGLLSTARMFVALSSFSSRTYPRAVSISTGVSAVRSSARNRVASSIPLMYGICRSVITRFGRCWNASVNASSPSRATTVAYPDARSFIPTTCVMWASSSASRMVCGVIVVCPCCVPDGGRPGA